MKAFLLTLLMIPAAASASGVRLQGGVSRDVIMTSVSSPAYGITSSATQAATALSGSVGYLQSMEDGWCAEANAGLTASSFFNAGNGPVRVEVNACRTLFERYRVLVGPSLLHIYGTNGSVNKTGWGYQLSAEIDLNENAFASVGFYDANFSGEAFGARINMEVQQTKLMLGWAF